MPEEDEGRFLIAVKAPLGSSIEYTESRIGVIEEILAEDPEVQACRRVVPDAVEQELGQPLVGLVSGHDAAVDRLIVAAPADKLPIVAEIGELEVAQQVGLADHSRAAAEILEVLPVGDLGNVGVELPVA